MWRDHVCPGPQAREGNVDGFRGLSNGHLCPDPRDGGRVGVPGLQEPPSPEAVEGSQPQASRKLVLDSKLGFLAGCPRGRRSPSLSFRFLLGEAGWGWGGEGLPRSTGGGVSETGAVTVPKIHHEPGPAGLSGPLGPFMSCSEWPTRGSESRLGSATPAAGRLVPVKYQPGSTWGRGPASPTALPD